MKLEEKIAKRLLALHKTLSVAESCTGGLLCHRLTNISGSSGFLKAGCVVYSNESKVRLLKIPKNLLEKYGAVSAPVAKKMARGIQKIFHTDFGIGITGIAGPTGGTKEKPAGLVFVAVATPTQILCTKSIFKNTRLIFKQKATNKALKMLSLFLF